MTDIEKPTLDECLKTVREINKGISAPEEALIQRARWLYFIHRLSFPDDMSVFLDLIKHEIRHKAGL